MITIYVEDGDLEAGLRRLKKRIAVDGILRETSERRYFRSNRQKQRLKQLRCQARRRRVEQRRGMAD